MTKYTIEDKRSLNNVKNLFKKLISMNVIPIINENDAIATEEIELGDNDNLSAHVAEIVGADLLIILTDIDGFYSENPAIHPDAKLVGELNEIDDEILKRAGGSVSGLGTGGMYTKLIAGKTALTSGISTIIMNGEEPKMIYDAVDGKEIGTLIRKAEK